MRTTHLANTASGARGQLGQAILLAAVLAAVVLGAWLLHGGTLAHGPRSPASAAPHARHADALAVGEAWRRGELPLWQVRPAPGAPLLARPGSQALYPSAFVHAIVQGATAAPWILFVHLVLGGVFAHRLVLRLGGGRTGAFVANASTVLLLPVLVAVDPRLAQAAIWFLPALEATWVLLRERAPSAAASLVLALSVMLAWFAGVPAASVLLCYLLFGTAGVLVLAALLREGRLPWPDLAYWCIAVLAGLLLAGLAVVPALAIARETAQPQEPALQAALPAFAAGAPLELVLPGALAPFAGLGLGLGLPLLLLAGRGVAAAVRLDAARRGTVLLLAAGAGLGLLAAWPLGPVLRAWLWLPGFELEALSQLLLLPVLALPVLAGLGATPLRGRVAHVGLTLAVSCAGLGVLVYVSGDEAPWRDRLAALLGGEARDTALVLALLGTAGGLALLALAAHWRRAAPILLVLGVALPLLPAVQPELDPAGAAQGPPRHEAESGHAAPRAFVDAACKEPMPEGGLLVRELRRPEHAGVGRTRLQLWAAAPGWLALPLPALSGWIWRARGGDWQPAPACGPDQVAVPIRQGTQRLELRYAPPAWRHGLFAALHGLVTLAVLAWLQRRQARRVTSPRS